MDRSDDDAEIVTAFLEESRENLDQLDRDLVELEDRKHDPALLAQVYRTIHTVKGTCGFLGYGHLEALTHSAENLLDALRAGRLELDAAITTSLLHLVDAVREVLATIEATGGEGEGAHLELIAEMDAHLRGDPLPSAGRPGPAPGPGSAEAGRVAPGPAPGPAQAWTGPARAERGPERAAAHAGSRGVTDSSVRVDVAILDRLMNLVGELDLAGTHIGDVIDDDDGPVATAYRHLRRVSVELEQEVMQARLQPIGTVTARCSRMARDLSASLGKRVHVDIDGDDAGVDKAVSEALRDPLLHLVRNAVDHGIESPAVRLAAGKDAEGRIRIRITARAGRVRLELSDDGRGIDPARLRTAAVDAGLLSAEDARSLTARQSMDLMFLPGLSTSKDVSTVSGRGVGMDVVRVALQRIGGSIDVTSEPGHGTRFQIDVPMSLAIMPVVVVWSGGHRYGLAQANIREVLTLDPEEVTARVHDVGGVRSYLRPGVVLPLIDLAAQLSLPIRTRNVLCLIDIEVDERRFGIVVDAVGDRIDAMVKPLTRATQGIPVFAGVTILGDGCLSLIIDPAGLSMAAGVDGVGGGHQPIPSTVGERSALDTHLLATLDDGTRVAVPLDRVSRLEHVARHDVRHRGPDEVMAYHDGLLALVRPHAGGPVSGADGPGPAHLQVVVCDGPDGPIGVVVAQIDDVGPEPAPAAAGGAGLRLLDVDALATSATRRNR